MRSDAQMHQCAPDGGTRKACLKTNIAAGRIGDAIRVNTETHKYSRQVRVARKNWNETTDTYAHGHSNMKSLVYATVIVLVVGRR